MSNLRSMKVSPVCHKSSSTGSDDGTSEDKGTYLMDEHGYGYKISISTNTECQNRQTNEQSSQPNNTNSYDTNLSLQTIQKQDEMFYKRPKKGMLMRIKAQLLARTNKTDNPHHKKFVGTES